MNTRRVSGIVSVLAAALVAVPAVGSVQTKVSVINGIQEVPSNLAPGIGCARYLVDPVANTMEYYITYSGLTGPATGAHFHGPAGPGANGGVVFGLAVGNPIVGTWNYPEALEASILGGDIYVNIHTAAFPGGEIRGQIVDMVAKLNGAQENPPVLTPASGVGLFQIDTVTDRLNYHIIYGGLAGAETAAHIHGLTLHTGNAPNIAGLPIGSPKIGVWNYPAALEDSIYNGETYVNIHSNVFPGGEIRGQIVSTVVPIDGTQEVPPVASPGCGCALVAEDKAGAALSYFLEYSSLTGPATLAHIHGFAPAGANAGVQHNIGVANPAINMWMYGAGNQPEVQGDLSYFNIHTAAFGGGEIRGQLVIGEKPCPQDLNCNGMVDFADILLVIGAWGPAPGDRADLDGNGNVGFSDILIVIGAWGPCP